MQNLDYYGLVRSEIAPLLPDQASRIVDFGCGAGATLAWLRQKYPSAYTIGVESNGNLKDQLCQNAHEAHIADLMENLPDLGTPDLMLFLDVLEHLPDPAAVLKRLTSALSPGGSTIVSVPNVAHLSVAMPLILKGQFDYVDAGILDKTHLRFFVRRSAVALLEDAGFVVDRGLMTGFSGPRSRLVDAVTLHSIRTRLSKQYILRGVRAGTGGRIRWDIAR
jgi:2-polyprenyl-3-methyl-5-hydroxy-6-metoxy-1,4-benzoquinol methylase